MQSHKQPHWNSHTTDNHAIVFMLRCDWLTQIHSSVFECYLHLYLSSRWALQRDIIPVLNDRVRIFPVRPLSGNKTTCHSMLNLPENCVCVFARTCRRHWAASSDTCRRTAGRWPGASGSVPAAGTDWSDRWPAGRCPAAAHSASDRAGRTPHTPSACSAGPLWTPRVRLGGAHTHTHTHTYSGS